MSENPDLRVAFAREADYEALEAFYREVADAVTGSSDNDPQWEWGVHPCEAELHEATAAGTLLVGWAGDASCSDASPATSERAVVSALVLDGTCADGYETVPWQVPAAPHEVLVVHLFGVHPRYQGQGYARRMIDLACDEARNAGAKVVRLDVLAGNVGAQRAYERMGFANRGPARLSYPDDPSVTEFVMFERAL